MEKVPILGIFFFNFHYHIDACLGLTGSASSWGPAPGQLTRQDSGDSLLKSICNDKVKSFERMHEEEEYTWKGKLTTELVGGAAPGWGRGEVYLGWWPSED